MNTTTIEHFDDLLRIARAQPEPQRLLLVFASAGLPDQPSTRQQAQFAQAQGGTLEPLLCVDKKPEEIASFAALLEESHTLEAPLPQPWSLGVVAALGGVLNEEPSDAQVDAQLHRMVESIRGGMVNACPSTARASRCSCNRASEGGSARILAPPPPTPPFDLATMASLTVPA